jgi:hypothetical protein
MYILSYLLFSLIIIIISFRNIADLQEDKQLLSGNNNGESNSNTDLLQLADTIICLNDNEWENLDLFTMWFKGIGVPTSSKAKSWQRTKHTGIIGVPKNTWKKRERRINHSRSLPKLMMVKIHLFCTGR